MPAARLGRDRTPALSHFVEYSFECPWLGAAVIVVYATMPIAPFCRRAGWGLGWRADRYVHIEPSGEIVRLVMDEPQVFADPVQVGENASVLAGLDKIGELRSSAAIITAPDSTDGPILVSSKVLD